MRDGFALQNAFPRGQTKHGSKKKKVHGFAPAADLSPLHFWLNKTSLEPS
jgi:hypothetical protein